MIITTMILAMIVMAKVFLFVFPNLPETPEPLEEAGTYLVGLIESGAGILSMVYTPTLLAALVVVLIAVSLFDQLYWLGIYLLKKIPFINVK